MRETAFELWEDRLSPLTSRFLNRVVHLPLVLRLLNIECVLRFGDFVRKCVIPVLVLKPLPDNKRAPLYRGSKAILLNLRLAIREDL